MVILMTMPALSCVSTNDLVTLESGIEANRVELLALQKETPTREELQELRRVILDALQEIRGASEELHGEVGELSAQINQLESKLDDTNFRLTQLTQQIAATNQELQAVRAEAERVRERIPPVVQRVVAEPPPQQDPEEVYAAAYGRYQDGDDNAAIQEFRRFMEAFPDHELADNALYWSGESYYRLGRFQKAISFFDQVLDRFEESERGPSALLKKGLAYLALDQGPQGELHLRRVVCEHSETDEARLAKQRLKELGIDVTC